MSLIKQELLAAIEIAPDEALIETLIFLKTLTKDENIFSPNARTSKLDRLSEFLQSEGFYEDEFIDRCMVEIEGK